MSDGTVGIVGLGRMGGNMAANLVESGFEVRGFDVREDALGDFEDVGGIACESVAAVAVASSTVLTSLPDPAAVEDVYLGVDGLLASAATGTVALETSTVDPGTTLAIADAADEHGVDVLGAPVSGGPGDSRDGTLTVMVGGSEAVFDRPQVQTVLDALGETVYHTGEVDAGHTVKLVNNVLSMGNLLLAMEAVSLGSARGVDGEVLLEVLGSAGGASNQLEKRLPRVLNRNFEPGFTVEFARKDLGLARDAAEDVDRPLLVGSLVHSLFTEASAEGLGEEDACAVVKLFERYGDAVVEAESRVDETFEGY